MTAIIVFGAGMTVGAIYRESLIALWSRVTKAAKAAKTAFGN